MDSCSRRLLGAAHCTSADQLANNTDPSCVFRDFDTSFSLQDSWWRCYFRSLQRCTFSCTLKLSPNFEVFETSPALSDRDPPSALAQFRIPQPLPPLPLSVMLTNSEQPGRRNMQRSKIGQVNLSLKCVYFFYLYLLFLLYSSQSDSPQIYIVGM